MPKGKDAQQRFRAGERAFCVGERASLLHAYLISTRVPIFEKHRVIFARYCLGSCDLEYITVLFVCLLFLLVLRALAFCFERLHCWHESNIWFYLFL